MAEALSNIPIWSIALVAAGCALIWAYGSGRIKLPSFKVGGSGDTTVQSYFDAYKLLVESDAKHSECADFVTRKDGIEITFKHLHEDHDETSV